MDSSTDVLEPLGITADALKTYWMPTSGNRQFKEDPRIIVSAEGHYYRDAHNREIFDSLSGLWTTGLGHRRKEIVQAITEQADLLDYSPSFQFAHPKAIQLAERITQFMPSPELNRVFFTGSGSESVDTALKIARAYWHRKGKASKTGFIGRVKGYHGVNFGGTSVGGIVGNRALYGQGIQSIHLPHTMIAENAFSKGQPEHGAELADRLKELIALHHADTIAAVIVEPLSGSAGVIPPPIGYLKRLRQICDEHDILLVFDEVITAFGRMGAWTGAEEFDAIPDLLLTAKQLTNGSVPMGAVIAKQHIHDTFMETAGAAHQIELPHGYTYSAHPLACAAALATLDLLEKEQINERVKSTARQFEEMLHSLQGSKHVTDIRNYGLAGALTLSPYESDPTYRPFAVAMACWKHGAYVRFGGDTIQLGLPFTVDVEEIDRLINMLGEAINSLD